MRGYAHREIFETLAPRPILVSATLAIGSANSKCNHPPSITRRQYNSLNTPCTVRRPTLSTPTSDFYDGEALTLHSIAVSVQIHCRG